jgi:hypothetical protein
MTDPLERLDALERRLQILSDELEIMKLLSRYGPAADSADGDAYASLYTTDGVLDSKGTAIFRGLEELRSVMAENALHLALVDEGCAHIGSMPYIHVDGDIAVAFQYHRLYMPSEPAAHFPGRKGAQVVRLSFIRNDLARTADGWRIRKRTSVGLQEPDAEQGRRLLREVDEQATRKT